MRFKTLGLLLLLLAGCGESAPPFDELALRDALQAEPDAIALMPAPARARLAARFEAASAADPLVDDVRGPATSPAALVSALDQARQARLGEALIVGTLTDGAARPLSDRAAPDDARALPPLESAEASSTTTLELGALDAGARSSLLALLDASGARRLERVTGWPVGAIAIGDSVYVNASWLVAQAPADTDAADGGAPTMASGPSAQTREPVAADERPPGAAPDGGVVSTTIEERSASLNLAASAVGADGGTAPLPVDPGCAPTADSCAGDTDGDDSDDSCDGTGDDDDSCSAAPDEDPGCQVAAGGARLKRHGRAGTLTWLLAPLGFLLFRRRA